MTKRFIGSEELDTLFEDRVPTGYRPLYKKYQTIGTIIEQNDIYKMTEQEWQTQCMIHSDGNMHPIEALDIYRQLMREAGL